MPICAKVETPETPTTRAVVLELEERLSSAEAVLRSLEAAQARSDRELTRLNRSDPMKEVTGRSAIERAIAATRSLIDSLRRTSSQLRAGSR